MSVDILVQNIKSFCASKGTTPTAACEASGAGRNFMDNLKKGSIPSVVKVQLLADYLIIGRNALAGFIGTYTFHTDTQLLSGCFLRDTSCPAGGLVDIHGFLRHGNSLLFGVELLSRGAARGLPAKDGIQRATKQIRQSQEVLHGGNGVTQLPLSYCPRSNP